MSKKSDYELIAALSLELTDRYKLIAKLLKDNNGLMKHLAASAIHTALFMRDIEGDLSGVKIEMDDDAIKHFINECGCNFNDR